MVEPKADSMSSAVMGTYNRFSLSLVKGRGCWVWDNQNRRHLDAVAGIATCALGHSDRVLRRALSRQLRTLQHVSNLYQIPEQEQLAKWLVANGAPTACSSAIQGEANEAAIKLARKHGHRRRGIDRRDHHGVGQFHGRTLAAVSATGQPRYEGFEPMVEGFEFFPYNDGDAFEQLLMQLEQNGPKVAAVLIEPLQGEGGVNPGDPAVMQRIRKLCSERDILLIFDEVQVGMGRTGTLWGYQQLGVTPDALTLAKGLGGGHVIGALLVSEHADVFEPGDHASTFGGNPFACRAGLTVASELQRRDLLKNVRTRGEQLNQGLEHLVERYPDHLAGSRGWGLLQGLVLKDTCEFSAADVVKAALEEQLLLVPAGTAVVRMVPPLVIGPRESRPAYPTGSGSQRLM